MPSGLKRYQQAHDLHFITFSCYHRKPLLETPSARRVFEVTLERTRVWYGFFITGYVVMPEHVHLLMSEPERGTLALALQMLKQISAHELRGCPTLPRSLRSVGKLNKATPRPDDQERLGPVPFWQARYYDFNVWNARKQTEKLRYMHRNPVARGLVASPEDWEWSSFRHYLTGVEGVVEIESHWTARKREALGIFPQVKKRAAS
jgi:putative transposase